MIMHVTMSLTAIVAGLDDQQRPFSNSKIWSDTVHLLACNICQKEFSRVPSAVYSYSILNDMYKALEKGTTRSFIK